MLQNGDLAPDFALPDAEGKTVTLNGLKAPYKVVYFYPKDNTSGCTTEARSFSDLKDAFDAAGAEVIGISPDSVKSHANFRDKHGLRVTLVSDQEKAAIEAFGVWVEKKMYGRAYMGVERATFLIGPDGKILKSWGKVKVPGHAAAVLDAVREAAGAS
ncbi:alkyl hydroperoxide reductase/ Thiol specific antioxidant/ Mal allergen [Rhodomicrobium vannielii ATCC 17100]|jgi:thioredoxin-dependent peroxiredoxin|uniref:thioredoxin-dependent peroxiredoxin n=1 Tax=Rhodomicrobium vannielii (strain ATCC 17100 / DSM 162 / LMG 4299 / NCIMB 10020 / ATH 3.1.1) TaxID=648757 RepID=E3I512_RHOVT|nr:thioredoxin-dependent thiol peroxidase [Rhodomicrobium vannielii]ADP69366.1 alkyl hydroperoxide reductase/ Thiol specific antioxidant/ Mal allergen [Rhodomicrobium vannielii ATCC 17100]